MPTPAAPIAERRLVSVLFADLVGFTAASEGRDAEETRELLSRYFDLARTLIGRYGGTVEKFIGDAVMAVWGTPVATESDAERAVRAALDLVASVPELDPALQARVAVLTGEAAVTLGAEGQGMVAGDIVNTASRAQGAAEPGTVLVGETTRRVTEQAIVYEDAGAHELKGKGAPVQLWVARRVVSGVGGTLRSTGLEAPFVGRDRELKRIKDLFHACAEDGKAHLVSVTGIAGIGKSRLAWEFEKYIDGLVGDTWWHRGRCLAYGEGVAYWALADMVRMRCRIAEDDDPLAAREKLAATLSEHLLDPEERTFVEPRLAQLLGLDEGAGRDQQDLFSAWRLLFERLSDAGPVVLAFEDMQWADSGLLDFVEYLLEWSRDHPVYVITLARPELLEKRPTWGAGQRNFTSLYLEPLPAEAMGALLEGLVPGLPDGLKEQILVRAEGVPLYAVETVRMLLARGLLSQEGAVYRPTGEIGTLEVPESLQALIAARLDGLSADERRLLQDAAVLGKTFTRNALVGITELPANDLESLLLGLVRKEVLAVQSDPRSPEHGQYGFLQDLLRHVAYEMLSRRDRKTRHLAAARHLTDSYPQEDEVVEVLASHYVAAYDADPGAEDAATIRSRACELLTRAGERAASLGAPEEGRRYYQKAADLSDEQLVQAELLENAGRLAVKANDPAGARTQLEKAAELLTLGGDRRGITRVSIALAELDRDEGHFEEATRRLEEAVAELEQGEPNAELASALNQLGRTHRFAGREEAAAAPIEQALTLAERLRIPDVFADALVNKGLGLLNAGRLAEARVLLEAASKHAHAEQLDAIALRAENNLAFLLESSDRPAEALESISRAIGLARRRGDRRWESQLLTGQIIDLFEVGRWEDALAIADEEMPETAFDAATSELANVIFVYCERGELGHARQILDRSEKFRAWDDAQYAVNFAVHEARILRAEDRHTEALAAAERALAVRTNLAITDWRIKRALVEATEAALALADHDKADDLLRDLESLQPGELGPFLQAHGGRLRAHLDSARGNLSGIDERFRAAASMFREFGYVFRLAVTQLEHAEWLGTQRRPEEGEPLRAEACETFAKLKATPWLNRAAAATTEFVEAAV